MAITRRHLLQSGAIAAIAPALEKAAGVPAIDQAQAQTGSGEPVWRHALSLFGDVKYPADFQRFDYVNPNAPKGGVMRQISIGTFDNFNIAVVGREGHARAGRRTDLRNADYAVRSTKPATYYGLLAESVAHPDDYSWVKYRLRKEARWHDGSAGDAGRRDLLPRSTLKKYSPILFRPITGMSPRPKRPANARSPSPSIRPAIANCRPSSANSRCCRSIGGKAPTATARSATFPRPRWRSRWAPVPIGSRNLIRGPLGRCRAREGLLGRQTAGADRLE